MIHRLSLLAFIIAIGLTQPSLEAEEETQKPLRSDLIRQQLEDACHKKVFVVAHRAAWKRAPENSALAVSNAIGMGVDIIEVDIRKTKDGQFVLMHDRTVNRTTNGKGQVTQLTLEELGKLYLKGPDGGLTDEKIPTLSEILLLAKGKVLINLDKAEPYLHEILPILDKTGTSRQVILKGNLPPQGISELLDANENILFMPKFQFSHEARDVKIIDEMYPLDNRVRLIEIRFKHSNHPAGSLETLTQLKEKNVRAWVNTLMVSHSADYTDKKALENQDAVWGALIDRGFSIIQTDEPKALLDYLKSRSLHDWRTEFEQLHEERP